MYSTIWNFQEILYFKKLYWTISFSFNVFLSQKNDVMKVCVDPKRFFGVTLWLLFFFIVLAPYKSIADNLFQSLGRVVEWKQETQGIWLKTHNGAQMRITVYSPSVLRVRVRKDSAWDDHSYAVITSPLSTIRWNSTHNAEHIILQTDSVKLTIQKKALRLRLENHAGKLINEDEPALGTGWIGQEMTTFKRLLPDEKFLGLGEKTGDLNRRGNGYTHWNTDAYGYGTGSDPLYGSVPFYIGLHRSESPSGIMYGVFFDNTFKTTINFGASTDRYSSFSAEDGEMNYYYIYRSTIAEIIEDYTWLTGRMELPPIWALGYHQCRYSYFPDKEVLSTARIIREKKIPADVLWFDIHYMDAYKIFTWHPYRFPQHRAMLSELEQLGFKNVVILDPGIKVEKGYNVYEDGVAKNIFLRYPDGALYKGDVWPGTSHFPDFTNPRARTWWGDWLKTLVNDGIDGFWTDMNEPAVWGQRFPDIVEFDFEGNKATHKKGHNVYGMQMARATFENAKEHFNGKRPFVLTRAFYAGVQRYAAVWTGDNTSSEDQMLLGVRLINSMGLSGMPFVGVDVGGFNGGGSRELFARWISIGALSPFFRVHAAINTKEQDPWSFGEDVEEISKRYIGLRYQLLPYLYSAFYEASKTGLPVARTLAINNPFDDKVYDWRYQNQYFLGPAILVAPVTSSQTFAKIYLPDGEWYDVHTDKHYTGKQEIIVETPLERLPLFVKAGSIIPMQSLTQSTSEQPDDTLRLHIYKGSQGLPYTYYEDDGETYKYQKNQDYLKRQIVVEAARKKIQFSQQVGTRTSKFRYVRCIFHGFDVSELSKIRAGGKNVSLQPINSSLFPALSAFDPLNSAIFTNQELSGKSIIFPNIINSFAVEW